jgi:hypothetical protein
VSFTPRATAAAALVPLAVAAAAFLRSPAAAATTDDDDLSDGETRAIDRDRSPTFQGERSTTFIPLPLYANVPNEGATYGVLPVFLRTLPNKYVYSIIAPSVSWNSSAGFGASFRYFRYLDLDRTYSLVVSATTTLNRTFWFTYDNVDRKPGHSTQDLIVMARQNIFYRFFGLGPETPESAESSYARLTVQIYGRWGYNLIDNLNLGGFLEVRGDHLIAHAISGLPETQVAFPTAPGIDGAVIVRQGASIRYDTRPELDYSKRGLATELTAALAEGITGTGVFGQLTWTTRILLPHNDFLQLAARAYWTQVFGGSEVPFYYRASLGGELLLRGYQTDRFIADGAWNVDVEERFRFLRTHLFHVIADWRIDPFLTVGQVYNGANLFSEVRVAGGVGLRAWVHPHILGRIDLALSSEGLRVYIVLGYPF